MAPKDENELQQMLAAAVKHPGPVAIRYPRGEGMGVPLETFDDEKPALAIGKGEILRGESLVEWDVALVALGGMVYPAQAAAALLEGEGIVAGVANARFAKPIDRELLVSIATRCRKIVTLEEHALPGGFGEAVLAALEEEKLAGKIPPVDVRRIGIPDQFIEHGSQKILRQKIGLDADQIFASALDFCRLDFCKEGGVSASTLEPRGRTKGCS
jgi:1-deoxy-D-xylulose-5-phosphate synthase